jgi:hypothetical protein
MNDQVIQQHNLLVYLLSFTGIRGLAPEHPQQGMNSVTYAVNFAVEVLPSTHHQFGVPRRL